ncbi:metal ABC transporter substrate-binding protein [Rarobacter faecitabidus]|uniref:Zinc/manganese transport system substrate-binding protein/manganese/iron transport system substrate-binding protein n=1 Tax=Rarobacter faecitabidus TaxID=13243 RepID=A0A542ZE70_RARFA|nr:metal ABC transporter substrate-binding protein [Rarobacter faecitabidus]TQL58591.1 zinc/manganese transport system substrate-binding protein/manganese/iron transport system substrate-binding protein [Rarobacter faecitabidus]
MRNRMLPVGVALAGALVLAGCGGGGATSGAPSATGTISVVATTTQVADFTRNVAGSLADVTQLIQPNQSAHSFDPTAADLLAVSRAKVLIDNGAGLEPWLSDITTSAGFTGTTIDSSEGIELGGDHAHEHADEDHADEDHAEDEDGYNPHVWTAPANAILMVRNIAAGLAKADPANATQYSSNADAYVAKLEALDAWAKENFDQVPASERLMVSNHDAFYYFLKAYDITFVGSIIPNFEDNAEPSASEVQNLIDEIKKLGVKAIFSEAAIDPKAAEQIASSAGVTVYSGDDALYGDSLGPAGSAGDTYIKATVHNVEVLLTAWGATATERPADLQ